MPPTLYMIADIRKYVIWKSKSEITIPIPGDAYAKVMRRVIEYAKLSGIMLLSQCATPFVCFATLELGEKKMISILLCSFSLHVVAFSFRSLRRRLCLYRSSDWNPIFLIQRSLITSWRLPSIFCTLLSLPIFFAPSSLRHFINHTVLKVNIWS